MDISEKIIKLIDKQKIESPTLSFFCVGTDRVTGDSLGPIVGSNLKKYVKKNNVKNVEIIGSLEKNFNNTNIEKFKKGKDVTIVIDSAISNTYNIGDIVIGEKALKVRQALRESKKINSNINIKCIVGRNFENEKANFIMLQNVKLGMVLSMAETVSNSLYNVIDNYN